MNKKYRKVIIAGNWKMNQLPSGVKPFVEELKTKLARYMLPDKIVLLPELPHTANMKIDRQTLRKRMTEQG